jgi:hypothetical protein
MADKVTIEFDKALMADLVRRIKLIEKDANKRKALASIYRQASKDLIKTAKASAPVGKDTYKHKTGRKKGENINVLYPIKRTGSSYAQGNLKASIKFNLGRNKTQVVGYVGMKRKKGKGANIKGDGWYRHMVAYGTKYQSANNFFSQAVSKSRTTVFNGITKGVSKRIDTLAKQNRLGGR